MERSEIVKKLRTWLDGEKDFNEGVNLLLSFSKFPAIARNMRNADRYFGKLQYEIEKLLNQLENVSTGSVTPAKEIVLDPDDKYPPKLRILIKAQADVFNQRSILSEALQKFPESNEPELIAKRKEVLDKIDILSAINDKLFAAKEQCFQSKMEPDLDVLGFNADNVLIIPEPETKKEQDNNKINELPASIEELKELKKRLQENNSRMRTQLDYQATNKNGPEKPMPQGPRRTKLEGKIAVNEAEIVKIDYTILALEHPEINKAMKPEVPAGEDTKEEKPEVPAGEDTKEEKPEVPAGEDTKEEKPEVPAGEDTKEEKPEVPSGEDTKEEKPEVPAGEDTKEEIDSGASEN